MTEETCAEQMTVADGAIVGSYFKRDGKTQNPVNPERVCRFMDIIKRVRGKMD